MIFSQKYVGKDLFSRFVTLPITLASLLPCLKPVLHFTLLYFHDFSMLINQCMFLPTSFEILKPVIGIIACKAHHLHIVADLQSRQ